MGRHSTSYIAARHRRPASPTAVGTAKYVGRVGALAVALGVGAAVAGGAANANADSGAAGSAGAASSNGPSADASHEPPAATKKSVSRPPRTTSGSNRGSALHERVKADAMPRSTSLSVIPSTGSKRPAVATPPRPRSVPSSATRTQRLAVSPNSTGTDSATPVRVNLARATPNPAHPIATVVTNFANALGVKSSLARGDSPTPLPAVLAALQLSSRDVERLLANHAAASTFATTAVATISDLDPPAPGDEVPTAYGNVGKWMLESNGSISDYGGQLYDGKVLLEPINVIIVDPTSTTKAAATRRLNVAMFRSGFPARPIHSTGFRGRIDDVTYGQLPKGLLLGYSDSSFLLPNDHGRIFGPDPVQTDTGYVWTGSFNSEVLGTYQSRPAHLYVSSDMARTALASRLVASGRATVVGMVSLDNAYDTDTVTTGDHDGYAVVLQLR